MARHSNNPRTTAPYESPTSEIEGVFAESERKRTQRDGVYFRVGDRQFDLWPSRFEYHERLALAQLTGFTPTDLGMQLLRQQATIEAFSAFIAMWMFQQKTKLSDIKMLSILSWLEEEMLERGTEFDIGALRYDDGSVETLEDENVELVTDEDAGPN